MQQVNPSGQTIVFKALPLLAGLSHDGYSVHATLEADVTEDEPQELEVLLSTGDSSKVLRFRIEPAPWAVFINFFRETHEGQTPGESELLNTVWPRPGEACDISFYPGVMNAGDLEYAPFRLQASSNAGKDAVLSLEMCVVLQGASTPAWQPPKISCPMTEFSLPQAVVTQEAIAEHFEVTQGEFFCTLELLFSLGPETQTVKLSRRIRLLARPVVNSLALDLGSRAIAGAIRVRQSPMPRMLTFAGELPVEAIFSDDSERSGRSPKVEAKTMIESTVGLGMVAFGPYYNTHKHLFDPLLFMEKLGPEELEARLIDWLEYDQLVLVPFTPKSRMAELARNIIFDVKSRLTHSRKDEDFYLVRDTLAEIGRRYLIYQRVAKFVGWL